MSSIYTFSFSLIENVHVDGNKVEWWHACILADMFIVSVVHVRTYSIGASVPHKCMPSPPVHAAAATCCSDRLPSG